jgi:uncharacterized OB-fold protein
VTAAIAAPSVGHDDAYFWDGVAQGKLLLRRCRACNRLQHPPTPMCPACGSLEWTTQEASGRGQVYSWIVSRHPNRAEEDARIVALIELEEGVRLVSNLHGVDPGEASNDMAVEVCYVTFEGGVTLPQFRPAGPERS